MNNNTYNGWSNYATWAVALWMDNDQGTQEYCAEMARGERDAYKLALVLKDEHDEQCDALLKASEAQASLWADLLHSALGAVNWDEIAEHLIADTAEEETETA